ncbi:MAG: glucosamine-6-phosphate deaminase [Actinomycetaceae bacterium]|nr:glucosamine-6-phosphate deaminase [Actinomycetaceae bacterium]
MLVGIFNSEDEVAQAAAKKIIDVFDFQPESVLGVATGSTPLPLYRLLREAYQKGTFSLKEGQAFALDEYVGLPVDHKQSYRYFLVNELVGDDKTGLLDENLRTPDGNAPDLADAAIYYDDAVAAAGVDIQILGIGSDGHIGFNEPSCSFASRTHVGALTAQTRQDNARFFASIDEVPTQSITQGLGTIMEAGAILLLATGKNKAKAVKQMVEGPVSARWPATILQHHPQVFVLVDKDAASELELTDYYRQNWDSYHRHI